MLRSSAPNGPPAGLRTVFVAQGCYEIANDPDVAFATVLGSCVAACIRDPHSGVGGMNHFLLPSTHEEGMRGSGARYGAYSMEALVNAVLKAAGHANRRALEAKVFGGGAVVAGLSDIGARNIAFVREWLARDGVPVAAEDLGGKEGRRVLYHPASGRAWSRPVSMHDSRDIAAAERRVAAAPTPAPKVEIELF